MAKKARTPKPPQRVQAPKKRVDTRKGGNPLSSVPVWGWAAGAAVVAVIAVVAALAFGGSSSAISDATVAQAMAAANCTFKSVNPLPPKKDPNATNGGYHADVPTLSTPTKGLWNTYPPAAGAHYGLWAVWGFYRQPVNPRQVVHNEEHGAVVLWWGPKVPKATVDKLESFYQEKPQGMFGTPIAGLGSKVAVTAWTGNQAQYYRNGHYGTAHVAICPGFDQKAFTTFRDAYRGKGPEGIPLSADTPGSGPQA